MPRICALMSMRPRGSSCRHRLTLPPHIHWKPGIEKSADGRSGAIAAAKLRAAGTQERVGLGCGTAREESILLVVIPNNYLKLQASITRRDQAEPRSSS